MASESLVTYLGTNASHVLCLLVEPAQRSLWGNGAPFEAPSLARGIHQWVEAGRHTVHGIVCRGNEQRTIS